MKTKKIGIILNTLRQNRTVSVETFIVPDLKHNLLAISKLTEKGFQIEMTNKIMSITVKNSTMYCEQ